MVNHKTRSRRKLRKIVAVAGGLLIMAGTVLLGVAILVGFSLVNVGTLLEDKYLPLFAPMMVLVGVLDILAAVVIARW